MLLLESICGSTIQDSFVLFGALFKTTKFGINVPSCVYQNLCDFVSTVDGTPIT